MPIISSEVRQISGTSRRSSYKVSLKGRTSSVYQHRLVIRNKFGSQLSSSCVKQVSASHFHRGKVLTASVGKGWQSGQLASSLVYQHVSKGSSNSSGCLKAHRSRSLGGSGDKPLRITSDKDVEASFHDLDDSQGLEAGVIPESRLRAEDPSSTTAQASTSGRVAYSNGAGSILYPPAQRNHIRESW